MDRRCVGAAGQSRPQRRLWYKNSPWRTSPASSSRRTRFLEKNWRTPQRQGWGLESVTLSAIDYLRESEVPDMRSAGRGLSQIGQPRRTARSTGKKWSAGIVDHDALIVSIAPRAATHLEWPFSCLSPWAQTIDQLTARLFERIMNVKPIQRDLSSTVRHTVRHFCQRCCTPME